MRYFMLILFSVIGLMFMNQCSSRGAMEENRSPEELLSDGDLLYNQGDYQGAYDTYKRIEMFYPTSDLDIDAKLRMAECLNKLERYEDQMDLLLQLLRENLIPEKVPAIYNQLGKYYEEAALFNPGIAGGDTADYKKAIEFYKQAIEYQDSEDEQAKIEARYRIALVEAKLGLTSQAIEHYREIADRYPDSPFAVLARVKLANPSDTRELSLHSDSLKVYEQRLATPLIHAAPAEKEEGGKVAPTFEEFLKENPVQREEMEESSPADTLFKPAPIDTVQ